MPIFPSSNIILIHIPKTGGSSLERYFYQFESDEFKYSRKSLFGPDTHYSLQHYTYADINNLHINKGLDTFMDISQSVFIAVVRNPYHRMVSMFYYYYNNAINQPLIYKFTTLPQLQQLFTEFIEQVISGYITNDDNHHRPQYQYLTTTGHTEDININDNITIIKFENLYQELNDTLPELNIKIGDLPHELKSIRFTSYKSHYTSKSLQMVEDYYHNDFLLFGYDKTLS